MDEDSLDDLTGVLDEIDTDPDDGGYPVDIPDEVEDQLDEIDGTVRVPASNRGRKIVQREKERRAIEMRKAGATYDQISKQLGWASPSSAHTAVKKGMDRLITEPAEELRNLQYQRLNHLLLVSWPHAQTGDDRAIATCLSIMQRMDALMGTEAPQKTEHTHSAAVMVIDGDSDSYIAALKRMAGEFEPAEARQLLQGGTDYIDAEIVEEFLEDADPED